ncbi:hypothetical protein [Flagellimonas sp.]|uniref:hypothetical protein n=1 Tax=Flagellimonas sp. TaxID=2058762 RepID=UPI003B59BF4D
MISKYKNIWTFLIVAFFLLVPFVVIKTMGADYEVFPAAIFPGGAGKKHIGKEISLNSMDLYGKSKETNQFVKLNKRSFLKKIYIHHMIYFITPDYLGALPYDADNDTIQNPYTPYADEEDMEQTRNWVRKGLSEQNCVDSTFLVKFTEIKIDKETREVISKTVKDERYFELYR